MRRTVLLCLVCCAANLRSQSPLAGREHLLARFGGSKTESLAAFVRDAAGNYYVAGATDSPDFPATFDLRRPALSKVFRVRQGVYTPVIVPGLDNWGSGLVRAAASQPGLLYMQASAPGALQLLFRSTDSGETWTRIGKDLPATGYVSDLLVDPADGASLLLLNGQSLFASGNAGDTWSVRAELDPRLQNARLLLAEGPEGRTLFACYRTAVLGISTDAGRTWTYRSNTPALIVADPHLPGAIIGLTAAGLVRSTDAGLTWSPWIASPSPGDGTLFNFSFAIDPVHPGTVYWWRSGGAAAVTRDSGNSWQPLLLGESSLRFTPVPSAGAVVAEDRYSRRWITSDAGMTWTRTLFGSRGSTNWIASAPQPGRPGSADYFVQHESSSNNAFLAKVDREGRLAWSTVLGGNAGAEAVALALDERGDVWMAGSTVSVDFPVTPGSYEPAGDSAITQSPFLAKFSPQGTLLSSSFFADIPATPLALAVDAVGDLYMTGSAYRGLPVSPGAMQPQLCCEPYPVSGINYYPPAPSNAFLLKIDRDGARIVESTYLWGQARGGSAGRALTFDGRGNLIVGGSRLAKFDRSLRFELSPQRPLEGDWGVTSLSRDGKGLLHFTTRNVRCPQPGPALVEADEDRFEVRSCRPFYLEGALVATGNEGRVILSGIGSPVPTIGPVQISQGFHSAATLMAIDGAKPVFSTALSGYAPIVIPNGPGLLAVARSDSEGIVLSEIQLYEAKPRIDAVVESVRRESSLIAPLARIAIRGEGFDPASQVLFDGRPVRVFSVEPGLILAEAPEAAPDGPWYTVTVEHGAERSNAVRVPAVDVNLSLYKTVYNADWSINSAAARARPGDTLHFVANGVRAGSYMTVHLYCVNALFNCGRIVSDVQVTRQTVPGFEGVFSVATIQLPAAMPIPGPIRIVAQGFVAAFLYDSVDIFAAPK